MSSDYSAIFQLHAELSAWETVNPIQGNNGGFGVISLYALLHSFPSFSHTLTFSPNIPYSSQPDFLSFLDAVFASRCPRSSSSCFSLRFLVRQSTRVSTEVYIEVDASSPFFSHSPFLSLFLFRSLSFSKHRRRSRSYLGSGSPEFQRFPGSAKGRC